MGDNSNDGGRRGEGGVGDISGAGGGMSPQAVALAAEAKYADPDRYFHFNNPTGEVEELNFNANEE